MLYLQLFFTIVRTIIETLEQQVQTLTEALKNLQSESNPSNETDVTKVEIICATDIESYKYGTWDIDPDNHDWFGEHVWDCKLASQSAFNKTIKPGRKENKDDKPISEAEQQIIDLLRIGLYLEEISRILINISDPSESNAKNFDQKINRSYQDLLKLGLSYAHKWKSTRRAAIAAR
ncbi:hypothetical protein AYI69_g5735 [Smittium culicis]|uniref:Uncharacterized protein n=1 Tax=Smittium culicis TaxID=133412 RepID=A0A1R1Y456_9FUNG|nr:hypothetical protein AYI69_g5735 [Smittium culicis]